MKRNVCLEQFYTTKETAEFCLSKLNLNSFDLIVEPSAGNGSFSDLIDKCLAFDIAPQSSNVKKADFLKLNCSELKGNKVLAVGNPPFGRQSCLAIKFVNKCSEFADTVAFILPKSFKKESVQNKLNPFLWINEVYELPSCEFIECGMKTEIPCSFFVFEMKNKPRKKIPIPKVDDFSFVKKDVADCSIRRVGFYSGRIEGLDASESSHYFVKWNDDYAKEKYLALKFDFDNVVGARSLSKTEILRKWAEKYQ